MMCKKLIVVLVLSLCLISSAGAGTVTWDFENGNDQYFSLWSVSNAWVANDDPNTAGDEALTGAGGSRGLPDYGLAWSVGEPNQFDGLKPAVAEGARVGADGLLDYSLGEEDIPIGSGTLNTFNLNQDGDSLHSADNDQIATSPIVTLGEDSMLTVWSLGGGTNTHAPAYDPIEANMYTDGSSGIAVLSAEEADLYAILATMHIQDQGTLTENTLDLSALAGRRVYIEVVDAFAGDSGWLAIDKIEVTNATAKMAGFVVQLVDGEAIMGFDAPQKDRLEMLGYNVLIINQDDISNEIFTRADANNLDILIVSESPSSSQTVPLSGTSTPVMHQEAYGWVREWALATRTVVNWIEGDNANVDIINDAHPIIADAGLSIGSMPFFNASNHWTAELVSAVAPGAEVLAQVSGADGNDYAVVFAIEKGAELSDGTAAASRIVGLSIPGEGSHPAEDLTDEAWAFFDAAIGWLDPPPPTAAMIVNPGDLSSGFDQAQHDRLESMGYEVTVVPQADVGSAFTIAEADTYDLLLISESISSSAADPLRGTTTPVMHNEGYGWDNWYLTTGASPGWQSGSDVDIVGDTHPVAVDAGVGTGPLAFYSASDAWTTDLVSALAPGAELIAQITVDSADYAIIFTIDEGAELTDGNPAPARIAGFSITGSTTYDASGMADEAWALWDATIRWLNPGD